MNRINKKNTISVVLLFVLLFSNLTSVSASGKSFDEMDSGTIQTQAEKITKSESPMVIGDSINLLIKEKEKVIETREQPNADALYNISLQNSTPIFSDGSILADEASLKNTKLSAENAINNPTITIQATKFWAGESEFINPMTIVLTKVIEGGIPEIVATEILNDSNEWFKEWNNLPLTNAAGVEYQYDLSEINVPSNLTTVTDRIVDGTGNITFIITNASASPQISATATLYWNDGSECRKPVQIVLTRTIAGESEIIQYKQTLNEANNWTYTWLNLDRKDDLDNPYSYKLTEDSLAFFKLEVGSTVDQAGNLSFTITDPFTSDPSGFRTIHPVYLQFGERVIITSM